MSDVALAGRRAAYTLRGWMRTPPVIIFSILMPVGLLVFFDSLFGNKFQPVRMFGELVHYPTYYGAGIAAYSVALIAFSGLLIDTVTEREGGRLKRYRSTPMPPWVFFGGEILSSGVLSALIVAAIASISILAYNVHLRAAALPALAVYVVLGVFSLSALAIAVSGWISTTTLAGTVGPFSVLVLAMISGNWFPPNLLPSAASQLARFLPMGPLTHGLQVVFISRTGYAFRPESILVLTAWGLVGLIVATRTFKWVPESNRS